MRYIIYKIYKTYKTYQSDKNSRGIKSEGGPDEPPSLMGFKCHARRMPGGSFSNLHA